GENAPFLLHRAAREAAECPLDNEGREARRVAALLLLRIGPRDDQEMIGQVRERDPRLLTIEHPAFAALHRGGLDGARVAACARLGQCVSRDLRSLRLRYEIPALLIL